MRLAPGFGPENNPCSPDIFYIKAPPRVRLFWPPPSPLQLPFAIMTPTGSRGTQFDRLLFANLDIDSSLSFSPTVPQQYLSSTLPSSHLPEGDPFVFDHDFFPNFTLPILKDEPDMVWRAKASTPTSLVTECLDPVNSTLGHQFPVAHCPTSIAPDPAASKKERRRRVAADEASNSHRPSLLQAWDGNDHQCPITHWSPTSIVPDPAASKLQEQKRRARADEAPNLRRRRATREPYSSVDQRKQTLERDDYVSQIFEEESQVLCAGCERRINLDKRGRLYLQNWNSHQKKCRGIKDGIVSRPHHFRFLPSFLIFSPSDPLATF